MKQEYHGCKRLTKRQILRHEVCLIVHTAGEILSSTGGGAANNGVVFRFDEASKSANGDMQDYSRAVEVFIHVEAPATCACS